MLKKLLILFIGIITVFSTKTVHAQSNSKWVTGYYAGWMFKHLPPEKVNYDPLTHIMHFSVIPNLDGSLDLETHKVTEEYSNRLITTAHSYGKKVLISIGGAEFRPEFIEATSEFNRDVFIDNLINFMQERGYDGIDIDWEPIKDDDLLQYVSFIKDLRTEMDKISPRPLLTSALMGNDYEAGAFVHQYLDQVNIMTYSLSDPEWNETSWHTSAIYGGKRDGSIDHIVRDWERAGIPSEKLGIGMIFYGKQWSGLTGPDQDWEETPEIVSMPYHEIVGEYAQNAKLEWDENAKAAYLVNDGFLSFDNEQSAKEKVDYIYNNDLGGIILWEIGAGYVPELSEGEQHPLLNAIYDAITYNETKPQQQVLGLEINNFGVLYILKRIVSIVFDLF